MLFHEAFWPVVVLHRCPVCAEWFFNLECSSKMVFHYVALILGFYAVIIYSNDMFTFLNLVTNLCILRNVFSLSFSSCADFKSCIVLDAIHDSVIFVEYIYIYIYIYCCDVCSCLTSVYGFVVSIV